MFVKMRKINDINREFHNLTLETAYFFESGIISPAVVLFCSSGGKIIRFRLI